MNEWNQGPFSLGGEWVEELYHGGERYVPLATEYSAAMHLGHMASYREALKYAYGRRVLDIGCGAGYGALYLASFGARHVTALDLHLLSLRYARAAYQHPRLAYLQADGMRLPFPDASFDFVLGSQVIEHMPAVDEFLLEVRRVLAPDGFCLFTSPNEKLFNPQRRANPFHLSEMDMDTYRQRMEKAFPRVQMQGIPQRCWLWDEAFQARSLKSNWKLNLEDYRAQDTELELCENLLSFGHASPQGTFDSRLPESLRPVVETLHPAFWDAAKARWALMALYPNDVPDRPITLAEGRLVQSFVVPFDKMYRLHVDLAEPAPAGARAQLYSVGRGGRRMLAETRVPAGAALFDWRLPEPLDSRRRAFTIEFDFPSSWKDRFRPKEAGGPISFKAVQFRGTMSSCQSNGVMQSSEIAMRVFCELNS